MSLPTAPDLIDECYQGRATIRRQAERIAELEALLDRVPHQTTNGYTFMVVTQCYKDCPRCEWEKMKVAINPAKPTK